MIKLEIHKFFRTEIILKRRYGRKTVIISPPLEYKSLENKFNQVLLIPDDYTEFTKILRDGEIKYIESQGEYWSSEGNKTRGLVMEKSELERCILFLVSKYAIPVRLDRMSNFLIEK